MEMTDKIKEPDIVLKEDTKDYYTDIYNPWQTKEQLEIWQEVNLKQSTWIINTSTVSVSGRTYTLSVPNPDWEIFSMWIDWHYKTFMIWPYNDEAFAYITLEWFLKAWFIELWTQYNIDYISWTNFKMSRLDWAEISYTSPNLVRTITMDNFGIQSEIDIIIDWDTYKIPTWTSSSSSWAIAYLATILPTVTYYFNINQLDLKELRIARIDWAVPIITSTEYDKFTYSINYDTRDTPSAWQYLDYNTTSIDLLNKIYDTGWDSSRRISWDQIIRDILWYNHTAIIANTTQTTTADKKWINVTPQVSWYNNKNLKVYSITKDSACTATRAYILSKPWGVILVQSWFSWNIANFNYTFNPADSTSFDIVVDNQWNDYTYTESYSASDEDYWLYSVNNWTRNNISWITIWTDGLNLSQYNYSSIFRYNWWQDTEWIYNRYYFWYNHSLLISKSDYSSISINGINHYTDPWSYPDNDLWYSLTTDSNTATIVIWTYTEIVITNSLSGNNYFIPFKIYPTRIVINAVSSWGSSEWEWKARKQSCVSKYWVTVEEVDNYIFKTDTNNFWKILSVTKKWLLMSLTTNQNNKLTYNMT